ncbi:TVP38/TMEM64 family protein [Caulobacter vibrioides]|uniref:TVP38/TMEM64 family protein n=1 Tax=Caulobacter vibrioides TaxID=155892 RepID=UPI000BB4BABB|nr:TVP38/TMEM64 family protein [Caulobacter vibrioides]ATC23536.1 TVP38/TMEM64 family protein [Caulobacter vibrioides]AZH11756.1 TVP38/TMEM64 family protein [Caulobacter vibrioides]PLR11875.1 TVP38/TMEM64 family protein [Caulobacter vibrioides]
MSRDEVLTRVRRFGPLAVVAVLCAAAFASGLVEHISLEELRLRGTQLQAFAHENPLLCAAIYLAVYVGTVAISLPGALILSLTGGFLFGPIGGGLAAVTGATGGSTVTFLVFRTAFGEALPFKSSAFIARIAEGLKGDAFNYLLTLRLIPAFPLLAVNVAAGVMNVRVRTFLLASVLGMIPSSFVYAGIGAGLGHVFAKGGPVTVESLLSPRIYLPIIGMGVLAFLPPLWRHWRNGRDVASLDEK